MTQSALLDSPALDDFDVEAILDDMSWDWEAPDAGPSRPCTGNACGTNVGCCASISPSSCGNTGGRNAMCVPCRS